MYSRYLVLGTSYYDKKSLQWSFNTSTSNDSNSEESYSYLRIVIDTGKKHQIRLHCNYALKTPIFGDTKYGFDQVQSQLFKERKGGLELSKTIFLHSGELDIPVTPGSKEVQRFTARLKSPMEKTLDFLQIPKGFYI